jgi:hypothetical protein
MACYNKTKTEGDGNKTFFVAIEEKQEGDDNFVAITFFVATKEKPKKKVMAIIAVAFFVATEPKRKV